ncbi:MULTISPECIES: hypothetical protein [Corynebacterium]|uniref:hypothetical protein n=1 Tax=Corynebacterium TaxID=1716 RepID=UPI00195AB3C7|nr:MULTISPECIES: hypothetical protein [Corynebacterium]MDN8624643.1 hypothetical protein [Corynebacterium kroppenstedtii]QRQ65732.1 hypothetical protein I6J23_04775 [Corynebacterium kroppenstedtii]
MMIPSGFFGTVLVRRPSAVPATDCCYRSHTDRLLIDVVQIVHVRAFLPILPFSPTIALGLYLMCSAKRRNVPSSEEFPTEIWMGYCWSGVGRETGPDTETSGSPIVSPIDHLRVC